MNVTKSKSKQALISVHLQCPGNTSANVRSVVSEKLSQPEVPDFRVEIMVEEDVAGLNVAMHDAGSHLFVQKTQPPRDA